MAAVGCFFVRNSHFDQARLCEALQFFPARTRFQESLPFHRRRSCGEQLLLQKLPRAAVLCGLCDAGVVLTKPLNHISTETDVVFASRLALQDIYEEHWSEIWRAREESNLRPSGS